MAVQKPYSILIVSGSENFNSAIISLLPKASFELIATASSVAEAKRKILENDFDFVVINSPVNDDLGLRFAIDCGNLSGTLVLFLIQNELYGEIYMKLSENGVFTLSKPASKQSMLTALHWLLTAKRKLETAETKSIKMEDKMEEIRLVNKAKWLLISKEDLLEPEAHKYLEKEAMNRCVTKKEIAKEIIQKYS